MEGISNTHPHKKQTSDGWWDIIYVAMVVISIMGLAYILLNT